MATVFGLLACASLTDRKGRVLSGRYWLVLTWSREFSPSRPGPGAVAGRPTSTTWLSEPERPNKSSCYLEGKPPMWSKSSFFLQSDLCSNVTTGHTHTYIHTRTHTYERMKVKIVIVSQVQKFAARGCDENFYSNWNSLPVLSFYHQDSCAVI